MYSKEEICNMKYIKRIIDEEIQEKLSYTVAILIKGPKWIFSCTYWLSKELNC